MLRFVRQVIWIQRSISAGRVCSFLFVASAKEDSGGIVDTVL